MSARAEIENALYRWAWAYDECDLDGFVDALWPDASVTVETAGGDVVGPLEGHAAIREFFGSRLAIRTDARRHVTSNLVIDEESTTQARTRCYLTLVQYQNGLPVLVGTGWYKDILEQRDEVWKILRRHAFLETPAIPKP